MEETEEWSKLGSVLSPALFNIYIHDQLMHKETYYIIFADDLCITDQVLSFMKIEANLTYPLNTIGAYYLFNYTQLWICGLITLVWHPFWPPEHGWSPIELGSQSPPMLWGGSG